MHLFVENSILGGISVNSHWFAKASDTYTKDTEYECFQDESYIFNVDADNLCGWAMSQKLGLRNFQIFIRGRNCSD